MKFHAYLASGFGLWLLVQAFVNIGVTWRAADKGLTLPSELRTQQHDRRTGLAGSGARVHHELPAARAGVAAEAGMIAPVVLIMAGGTGGHV